MDLKQSVNEIVTGLRDRIEHVAKTYLERVTEEIQAIAADARGAADFGSLAHRWGKVVEVRDVDKTYRKIDCVHARIATASNSHFIDGGIHSYYEHGGGQRADAPVLEPGQYLLIVELRKL